MYAMYQKLKVLVKKALPRQWMQQHELQLRAVYARYFVPGGSCFCAVCNRSLKAFIPIEKGELICPACGSGKRHRRLFQLLRLQPVTEAGGILDFSPNKGFMHYAQKEWKEHYLTTSYDTGDSTDFHYDITCMDAPSDQYDVIVCYHVLEHIPDDAKALAELYRILKPGGVCYMQTPFKEGSIYEDWSITSPEARLQHFHQEDHVRIYSAAGLADRAQHAGFQTEILHYRRADDPEEARRLGYKDEEFIVLGRKNADGKATDRSA